MRPNELCEALVAPRRKLPLRALELLYRRAVVTFAKGFEVPPLPGSAGGAPSAGRPSLLAVLAAAACAPSAAAPSLFCAPAAAARYRSPAASAAACCSAPSRGSCGRPGTLQRCPGGRSSGWSTSGPGGALTGCAAASPEALSSASTTRVMRFCLWMSRNWPRSNGRAGPGSE